MYLFSGVTMEGLDSANARERFTLASKPLMVLSAKIRDELESKRMDSRTELPITGMATLSSKSPDAPPITTAASLPMTRMQTINTASGTTGLTLPGMMEEPGCRSGMWISARPVLGPEPIQRMSLQILVKDTAIVRNAPEASTRPSRFA